MKINEFLPKIFTIVCFVFVFFGLFNIEASAQTPDTGSNTQTQGQSTALASKKLNIATIERKPFSFKEGGKWAGISIELLEKSAKEGGYTLEYTEFSTFNQMLEAVQKREVDASIANISVTPEREKVMDFGQSYFISGQRLFINKSKQVISPWKIIQQAGLDKLFYILLAGLAVGTFLQWLISINETNKTKQEKEVENQKRNKFNNKIKNKVKRKLEEQTPAKANPIIELLRSFWYSLQRTLNIDIDLPDASNKKSKLLSLVFALFSIIILSLFTAQLASAFALEAMENQIKDISDLKGRSIGVIEGSTGELFVKDKGVNLKTFKTPVELYSAVEKNQIDAGMYDEPLVKFYIGNGDEDLLVMTGERLTTEPYGIAYPIESKNKKPLDILIIEQIRRGEVEIMTQKYLK